MKCPSCTNLESKVIDSRISKEGNMIRRRRECERCAKRFTTYERIEEMLPMVAKKDGRREQFDRGKILHGVMKACEKRPISVEQIEELVGSIAQWAEEQGESEVSGQKIGEMVMKKLHELDEVAYVRFASVYRSFKDLNEFMDELKDVLSKR